MCVDAWVSAVYMCYRVPWGLTLTLKWSYLFIVCVRVFVLRVACTCVWMCMHVYGCQDYFEEFSLFFANFIHVHNVSGPLSPHSDPFISPSLLPTMLFFFFLSELLSLIWIACPRMAMGLPVATPLKKKDSPFSISLLARCGAWWAPPWASQ